MKLYDVPQIDGKLWLRDKTDLWGFIQNGQYEPEETELIKKLVKPDYCCLDIGANIGYYTVLMAKLGKLVRAYEPEFTNYQLLIKNILLNQTLNVLPSRVALTDTAGQAKLYLSPDSHGMHRMYYSRFTHNAIIVNTKKLDDIWNEVDHFHVDFIKMDTEGSELGVIKGMRKLLEECKPTIVMEFHPPSIEEYGANPKDVYQFMQDLGYDIKLVPKISEPISYEELYFETNEPSGGKNLLCIKK